MSLIARMKHRHPAQRTAARALSALFLLFSAATARAGDAAKAGTVGVGITAGGYDAPLPVIGLATSYRSAEDWNVALSAGATMKSRAEDPDISFLELSSRVALGVGDDLFVRPAVAARRMQLHGQATASTDAAKKTARDDEATVALGIGSGWELGAGSTLTVDWLSATAVAKALKARTGLGAGSEAAGRWAEWSRQVVRFQIGRVTWILAP